VFAIDDDDTDVSTRLDDVRSEQSTRARDIRERADDGLLRYAYRDVEDDEAGRLRNVVRGFTFGQLGWVEVVVHFDGEVEVEAAYALVDAVSLDASALADALVARVAVGDPFAGQSFLVEEARGSLAASHAYRIRDGVSGALLLDAREVDLGTSVALTRLFGRGHFLVRFKVVLRAPDGSVALTVRRGFARPTAMVEVLGGDGALLGRIKPCWWSPFGAHDILDAGGRKLARLHTAWLSDDARFNQGDMVLARFDRASHGVLAGNDDTVGELSIAPAVAMGDPLRQLLVAAALYLDIRTKD
jgi:hypothetical protein